MKWFGAVVLAAGLFIGPARAEFPSAAPARLAATQALADLQNGNIDGAGKLLEAAGRANRDPLLQSGVGWAEQFRRQWDTLRQERRQAYDKTVDQVQMLVQRGKPSYAMDLAAKAYQLAPDKEAFSKEPWLVQLLEHATRQATEDEAGQRWISATRLYLDLGAVQPAEPRWKRLLKTAARRVRILSVYAPDTVRAMQKERVRDDDLVAGWLNPTTAPASRPATTEETPTNIDWRDTVRGVQFEMIWEVLARAQQNYWRQTSYKEMALGGLAGLEALLETKGVEAAFPAMGEPKKMQPFVQAVKSARQQIEQATEQSEQTVVRAQLARLRSVNGQSLQLPEGVWVSEFVDGALGELDLFSNAIWPSEAEEFTTATQGEFSGVGIQIERDEDGGLKVVSPIEDTPAYEAGIRAGDVITHVNGQRTRMYTLDQAVKRIKGPSGTEVTLTIKNPDGISKDFTLTRKTVKVASIKGWMRKPGGGWDFLVDPEQRIGYVRLTQFSRTTSLDLDKALEQLHEQGVRGLILDLRSDPGGLLGAATDVVDKFIKDGIIVSTRPERKTPNEPTVATAKGDGAESDLPLIVLVNQYSASASEIVSGALKDYHRALIVGERTFGKGSVQMLFPLGGRNAYLKLTTSHYYLPGGSCIHRDENSTSWGVDPNIIIDLTPEQMRDIIDARQALDVLRGADEPATNAAPATGPSTRPKKSLLEADGQLGAALLAMRLQLLQESK